MCDENGEYEITKENRQLEEKYAELVKEIEEKGELMTKQLDEKETGITTIETQMSEQLVEQIKVYKEQTEKKKEECNELEKVQIDYKTRYTEFEKSMRQSQKTLSTYEKEIGNLNRTIGKLSHQKADVTAMASG